MLKKLYKHEFSALMRNLWPVYLALAVLAVFNRISMLVDGGDFWVIHTIQAFLAASYGLAIAAVFVISAVIVAVRFFQHLMTHQGYLSFTLPVSATDHIVCKLVCGTVAVLISFVATLLSVGVLTIGTDLLPRFFENVGMVVAQYSQYTSPLQAGLVIVGIAVFLLISIVSSLLMVYAAIALGQQFKNRVAGAVVCLILLYMIVQAIGLFTFTAIPLAFAQMDAMSNVFSVAAGFDFFNLLLGYGIVLFLVLSTAYFAITRLMLTKKLNLE